MSVFRHQKRKMRDVRKNQIKSVAYQILIAFITYIFIMETNAAMPSAGIFHSSITSWHDAQRFRGFQEKEQPRYLLLYS